MRKSRQEIAKDRTLRFAQRHRQTYNKGTNPEAYLQRNYKRIMEKLQKPPFHNPSDQTTPYPYDLSEYSSLTPDERDVLRILRLLKNANTDEKIKRFYKPGRSKPLSKVAVAKLNSICGHLGIKETFPEESLIAPSQSQSSLNVMAGNDDDDVDASCWSIE